MTDEPIKSSQCNRCISAGGGDCATCIPEGKSTEPLTIKDLDCSTCSKRETLQCPIELAVDIGLAKHLSEVCGLACHPLALRVLAQPVVAELKKTIRTNSKWPKLEPYYCGVNEMCKIAIKLLKGDAP